MTTTTRARRNGSRAVALTGALGLAVLFPSAATAQDGGFDGQGSGTATVAFNGDGDDAEVSIDWQGLAAEIPDLSGTPYEDLSNMPFPHAQHIHAGGLGQCPTPDRDADGNGIIDTPEGQPDYGPVVTSITEEPGDTAGPDHTLDIEDFPTGDSTSYNRTIDLSADVETDEGTLNQAEQVRDENAVIVIHGLDPEIMPGESALEVSPINDARPDIELPLAATAPALCGELTESEDGVFTADLRPTNPVAAEQMDEMPRDGVATGGGSTAEGGVPAGPLALAAGLLAVAATGVSFAGRRSVS